MDERLHELIREAVRSVPRGRVATYGDIAARTGASSPRIVGKVLSEDGHDLPWHRVIRATGRPAEPVARRQLELLRAEGVLADDGKVDLGQYRWR
ncbi:MGMT family protein [Actinokineospora bangkokensis]|uniref:DNA methyltransferase n=1 Tax=Actinokineospora bangkokensis TaxID=1193682 RepID=A0A1Q9LDT2_9PSEU|nr:MGMT family protein [Actinokineospora bangkokensis]OLR90165.1 DNA methyltransferase [Actinokineospora bangkokensis]